MQRLPAHENIITLYFGGHYVGKVPVSDNITNDWLDFTFKVLPWSSLLNKVSMPTDVPTMVFELMVGGDLRHYLIQKRASADLDDDLYTTAESIEGHLSSRDLLDIGRQVASGLVHLVQFNVNQQKPMLSRNALIL